MLAIAFFQVALILGALLGWYMQGGQHEGALPLSGRIIAAVSIPVVLLRGLAILSVAVLCRAIPARVPISYPRTRAVRNSWASWRISDCDMARRDGKTPQPTWPLVSLCPSWASSASMVMPPASAAPAGLTARPSKS